jgi:hypothetical protein
MTMNRVLISALTTFAFVALIGASAVFNVSAQSAPPLPQGMKGSNPDDPRAKLKPGLYDAEELAKGLKHIQLLQKPEAFQLPADNPEDERVIKAIDSLGIPGRMVPAMGRLVTAQLAFANTDIAFQGKHLFLGNYYGISIYDVADSSGVKHLTTLQCPGGQGDVSVYKNLMFMSVEATNGRLDCGVQGFPIEMPQPGSMPGRPSANPDRFRGVRIFDISDVRNPKQVGAVQTCRGSHTHTIVTDPKDPRHIYVYVSGTSFVRQNDELAGCSDGRPGEDPNTARFRIEVIKVPLAAPQDAKVVSAPRLFGDEKTGVINALNDGGSASSGRPTRPEDTDQCHDITVYPELGLALGACSGNGILIDIRDPANPKRIDAVNDKNYAYWHSASFSNDGKTVVFTDEWGGGMGARCRANDPNVWGANALFELKDGKLVFKSYYKLPAAQGDTENCVAHNGSLIPVPGRDIKVQAWYQGGISVMDFTDLSNPIEIAYFDRGPVDPKMLVLGGYWSTYWYNGRVYGSEIIRGLDVFELTPTEFMTQNEIDAAKTVNFDALNVQTQERIKWSNKLVVAKAYIDQLERSKALSANQIAAIRKDIVTAEAAKLNKTSRSRLQKQAASLSKMSGMGAADAARVNGLIAVLRSPSM